MSSKAKLIISEPWDQSDILLGLLEMYVVSNKPVLLFRMEHDNYFALQPRYKGDLIEDIWEGKHIIVNIFEITGSEIPPSSLDQLKFSFIGEIELIN